MSDTRALDATMEQAIARQRAGRLAEAEDLYRRVLGTQPSHPVANHNLAVLTAQRGGLAQSLPLFKAALEADPQQGVYWLSYARGLVLSGHADEALALLEQGRRRGLSGPGFEALVAQARAGRTPGATDADALYAQAVQHHQAGRFDQAVEVYRAAAGLSPDNAGLLDSLGAALTAAGQYEAAITAYRQAIAIQPDFAEAHFHLGSVLSETGDIAGGFEHFMRRAELVYGPGGPPHRPAKPEPAHKLKHDREQRDYLAGGKAADDAPAVADLFRIEDGGRLPGPAINPANATPALLEQWRAPGPQMVVIEDFLTPEALDELRRYCAGSTIWRRIYEAGYIGATPEDGFAAPLLAQIAEEIQSTYPGIFAPHHFRYLGAFKYDSELSTGTNTHADNSAVNVNFYIAPDEANRDPASGGMEIWDVEAPDEETMRRYNSDEAAVRDFLKRSGAKSTIVPHRANRAIIFKSALFHKTDRCDFEEGYLNKRINVSLLFGNLGTATR